MKLKTVTIHVMILGLFLLVFAPSSALSQQTKVGEVPRISVEETVDKMMGGKALLVCSYGDDVCNKMLFEGALLRSEFEKRLPDLAKDHEILFYCD